MNHENRIILLEGVLNARELGGLPLKNGRKIRSGKLIRSGRLSDLTETDCKILHEKWNVTTIIDLRNDQEVSEHPNRQLDDAVLRHVSILAGESKGISREDFGLSMVDFAIMRARLLHEDGGSRKLLESMYGQMAKNSYCINKIKEFFDILLNQKDGSLLWHCTSGKDRTGVTGALLLYALGADLETIKEDYLYTNEQNSIYRNHLLDMMRNHGAEEEIVEEMRILESVDWNYIMSFLHMIEESYGDIDRFMIEELDLTPEKRELLQVLYTEA